VTEISYVTRLGDALEEAIAAPVKSPRRRRRRTGLLALAILLIGASGATVARLVTDSERLAIMPVECVESSDPEIGGVLMPADGRSPVETCARFWASQNRAVPPLVACDRDGMVVVLAGRGPRLCARVGLAALPTDFGPARARFARLERRVTAIEASADCIPPARLADRVRALLSRTGWTEWRVVGFPGDEGPCGHVRRRGGTPELFLSSAIDADARTISVARGAPSSLETQLHGERSLIVRLFDISGNRCFTVAGLERAARRVMAPTGRHISFALGRMPVSSGLEAPRGVRYREGCAIVVGAAPVYPAPGEIGVEVEIWARDGA
jgi:hypothetical protein